MSTCLVSAKDYQEFFVGITCPACGYHSPDRREFDLWFCPSTPDKCEGCEIDERRMECPWCFHIWPLLPTAPEAQP